MATIRLRAFSPARRFAPLPTLRSFPNRFAKDCSPGRPRSCTWTTSAPTEDWNVELDTSQDDPLLGESYVKFAWKGLQHQLSQGAGGWTLSEGRRTSYYKLIDSALPGTPVSATHEKDFFDGIDTSLPALASRLGADAAKVPWLRPQLEEIAKLVDEATAAVDKNPQSAGKPLLHGLNLTRELDCQDRSLESPCGQRKPTCWPICAPRSSSSSRPPISPIRSTWASGPGLPTAVPWPRSSRPPNGKVLAAVITAGKSFLLLAKLHNGSTVPMDLQAVCPRCSRAAGTTSCSWTRCRRESRRVRAAL